SPIDRRLFRFAGRIVTMVEADFSVALHPADRAREADNPHSLVVRFGMDKPLSLDAGIDLAPFQIAYQTYGTLNAERSNAVLICQALTGDQHVANVHPVTQKPGWWETMVGPGRPIDTDPSVLISLHGHHRTGLPQPEARRALGSRFPRHHHSRHGARAGHAAGPPRNRLAILHGRRLDGRDAGPAMVRELPAAGVLGVADRDLDASFGAEHRLPRSRPAGGDGRPGMAARALFRRRHKS